MALCGQLYPFHGDAGAGSDARRGEGDMTRGCPSCPRKMRGGEVYIGIGIIQITSSTAQGGAGSFRIGNL